MAMHEPSPRTSRLAIAGGLLAVIAIGGGGFLAGRMTSAAPDAIEDSAPAPSSVASPVTAPVVLQQTRTLGRADLIAMANRAADAVSSDGELPPDLAAMIGRRFDIAIAFGCNGPVGAESTAPLRWQYDAARQALRIHVSPGVWTAEDWVIKSSPDTRITGEGFWLTRPWSSLESCPTVSEGNDKGGSNAAPEHTLAVVQFRSIRSDTDSQAKPRAFNTVQRIAPEALPTQAGFQVRLTGRIDRLPDGQPVRCIELTGAHQRPVCAVAVSFDELRLESSGASTNLAVWPMGVRTVRE